MPSEKPLSVAEVFELQPGDENNPTWINPGMQAVVRSITNKPTRFGKPKWDVVFADETGSATVETALFAAPKFSEGMVVVLEGGMRRTEYNGKAQVALGKSTKINVVGKSVHHEEQQHRAATGAPAIDGTPQLVAGQTVGMAMKEALALAVMAHGGVNELAKLKDPLFWADVKQYASNIIRLSRSLEHGKLSPATWGAAREAEPASPQGGRSDPPKPATKPQPGPEGSAYLEDEPSDSDVPF